MVRQGGLGSKPRDSGDNFSYKEPNSSQKVTSKVAYQFNQKKTKRTTMENSPKRDMSDTNAYQRSDTSGSMHGYNGSETHGGRSSVHASAKGQETGGAYLRSCSMNYASTQSTGNSKAISELIRGKREKVEQAERDEISFSSKQYTFESTAASKGKLRANHQEEHSQDKSTRLARPYQSTRGISSHTRMKTGKHAAGDGINRIADMIIDNFA